LKVEDDTYFIRKVKNKVKVNAYVEGNSSYNAGWITIKSRFPLSFSSFQFLSLRSKEDKHF